MGALFWPENLFSLFIIVDPSDGGAGMKNHGGGKKASSSWYSSLLRVLSRT